MLVLQFHLEHRIGQRFDDHRHDFNRIFLAHALPFFVSEIPRDARDFAGGLPLRSRPPNSSTSIASSLLMHSLISFAASQLAFGSAAADHSLRQYYRPILCDGNTMFKVRAVAAVLGYG